MTEVGSPAFNLSHKEPKQEADLFSWADDLRTPAKPPKVQAKWELDVKGLISSKRWLKLYGLKRNQLQLHQILARIGFKHSDNYVKPLQKPVGSYYGEGLFHRMKGTKGTTYNITASKETLKDIEKHLKECLYLMKRRQEWLTSGSRKIFGVIQERCVCIVLDVSTMVQSQFEMYIDAVCEILEDQGSQLAKINLIRAQNDLLEWNERATPVSDVTLSDAINWVKQLDRMVEISNTCCTEAVVKALEDESLEAVYLFSEGDVNESAKELLRQKLKECNIPLHTISLNASKASTVTFLQSMASCTGGRFHAFVVKSDYEDEDDIMSRTNFHLNKSSTIIPNKLLSQKTRGGLPHGAGVREDVFFIWTEMEKARNILVDLQSLIANIDESSQFQANSQALVPHSTGKGKDNFSSKDWLQVNGLDANKLTIYHVLSGFAFRHIDDVIDLQMNPNDSTFTDSHQSLKLIEAKYCKNFPHIMWKDNQVVHVYVSAELYRNYERKMKNILGKIQQRIDWLQQGSREVFGSILEDRIYFLIDTSSSMAQNLKTVKEKLLQMFQEQLRHKSQFNMVKFDTKAASLCPRLENVDEASLKNAWSWVQGLEAEGSTNTLAALQIALSDPNTEGIYLLTDGRPDQPPQCVLSQIQLRKPVPIHTIAFNCNDIEANEFLHKLALDSGGRYHCYTTHGGVGLGPLPYEELQRGKEFLKRMSDLRSRCVMLDWHYNKNAKGKDGSASPRSTPGKTKRLAIEFDHHADTYHPHHPSKELGLRSQPVLIEMSHRQHRGKFGVNDSEIMDDTEIKHSVDRSLSEQGSPRSSSPWQSGSGKKRNKKPKKTICEEETNIVWLKKNGLAAKKMTLMDALGSTVVRQKRKYIPIINKHVLSKVFDDILPIAHVSPRSKSEIRLINPNGAHLEEYEKKLKELLQVYRNRLNRQIWEHMPKEEREKYGSRDTFFYVRSPEYEIGSTTIEEINAILEEHEWPIPKHEIQILLDEIRLGERYLELSLDLRAAAASLNDKSKIDPPTSKSSVCSTKRNKPLRKSKKILKPIIQESSSSDVDSITSTTSTESTCSSKSSSSIHQRILDKCRNPYNFQSILEYLTGESVIARSEFDGYFYDAVLVKCLDQYYSHVRFNHGEQQVTGNQFILPCSRNLPLPSLRLGDHVLMKTRSSSSEPVHYIPGVIIGVPERKRKFPNHYKVLLFNEKKKRALRQILYKISEERYILAIEFIHSRMEKHGQGSVTDASLDPPSDTPPTSSDSKPQEPDSKPKESVTINFHETFFTSIDEMLDKKVDKIKEICNDRKPVPISPKKEDASTSPVPVSKATFGAFVHTVNEDRSCGVLHADGTTTMVSGSDVIFEEEDAKYAIAARVKVVALHPSYQNSYAPATVTSFQNEQYFVTFYDGNSATLPRKDIYFISDAKFEDIIMFIDRCELKWEGQTVIARNDLDGRYYLGICKRRVERTRCFLLQWNDGSSGRQYITHMFGSCSRKRALKKGDYVLALRDLRELIYLPGRVLRVDSESIDVEFCDGTSIEGEDIQRSYYLSKDYFDEAVKYLQRALSG